ncbi:MAG TPA: DUF1847 domain-containing protein [Bacteroidales bacterium]|nr:DUF1847 domain-containing protein [Bacteroidales bacterium]
MENVDFRSLYTEDDRHILKVAEDSLNPHLDRVNEIIEYAREAGLKRLGIAHCVTFNRESELLQRILGEAGFEVSRVSCKYGRVPFSDLVPGYKGVSCNPAGQAKFLEENDTELNIMMGLCLGHDMIFNARSKAPVTPLVVKDRKLKHNTFKGLNPS